MDDDNVGQLCQICNRKDYMPYKCKNCKRTLCDEHYRQHQCRIVYNPPKVTTTEEGKKEYFCKACKKKLYTVNHFFCEKCGALLCLNHRHPQAHQCKTQSDNCLCIVM